MSKVRLSDCVAVIHRGEREIATIEESGQTQINMVLVRLLNVTNVASEGRPIYTYVRSGQIKLLDEEEKAMLVLAGVRDA